MKIRLTRTGYIVSVDGQTVATVPSLDLANWGGSGNADNPSLDIDDLRGFGPENINVEVHPNYEHVITLTPTKAGTYSIICNEYCGINHHTMASRLYVVKSK